jgi:hypothetical protein
MYCHCTFQLLTAKKYIAAEPLRFLHFRKMSKGVRVCTYIELQLKFEFKVYDENLGNVSAARYYQELNPET